MNQSQSVAPALRHLVSATSMPLTGQLRLHLAFIFEDSIVHKKLDIQPEIAINPTFIPSPMLETEMIESENHPQIITMNLHGAKYAG